MEKQAGGELLLYDQRQRRQVVGDADDERSRVQADDKVHDNDNERADETTRASKCNIVHRTNDGAEKSRANELLCANAAGDDNDNNIASSESQMQRCKITQSTFAQANQTRTNSSQSKPNPNPTLSNSTQTRNADQTCELTTHQNRLNDTDDAEIKPVDDDDNNNNHIVVQSQPSNENNTQTTTQTHIARDLSISSSSPTTTTLQSRLAIVGIPNDTTCDLCVAFTNANSNPTDINHNNAHNENDSNVNAMNDANGGDDDDDNGNVRNNSPNLPNATTSTTTTTTTTFDESATGTGNGNDAETVCTCACCNENQTELVGRSSLTVIESSPNAIDVVDNAERSDEDAETDGHDDRHRLPVDSSSSSAAAAALVQVQPHMDALSVAAASQPLIRRKSSATGSSRGGSSSRQRTTQRRIIRKFQQLDSGLLSSAPAPDVKIGQRVAYKEYYGNEFGTIRWIGRVPQISLNWTVGVEFDNAIGEGDGSLNGRRYFIAKDCFAKFLPLEVIQIVEQHVGRPEPGTMISVMSAAVRPGQMISIQRVSTVHVQHCFLNAPHRRPLGAEILAVNTRLHCQCPSCGPCAHVIKPPRTQRLARSPKNATHMCQFSTYTCCGMESQEEAMCTYTGNKITADGYGSGGGGAHAASNLLSATFPSIGNSWIEGSGYLSNLQAQQSRLMPEEYRMGVAPEDIGRHRSSSRRGSNRQVDDTTATEHRPKSAGDTLESAQRHSRHRKRSSGPNIERARTSSSGYVVDEPIVEPSAQQMFADPYPASYCCALGKSLAKEEVGAATNSLEPTKTTKDTNEFCTHENENDKLAANSATMIATTMQEQCNNHQNQQHQVSDKSKEEDSRLVDYEKGDLKQAGKGGKDEDEHVDDDDDNEDDNDEDWPKAPPKVLYRDSIENRYLFPTDDEPIDPKLEADLETLSQARYGATTATTTGSSSKHRHYNQHAGSNYSSAGGSSYMNSGAGGSGFRPTGSRKILKSLRSLVSCLNGGTNMGATGSSSSTGGDYSGGGAGSGSQRGNYQLTGTSSQHNISNNNNSSHSSNKSNRAQNQHQHLQQLRLQHHQQQQHHHHHYYHSHDAMHPPEDGYYREQQAAVETMLFRQQFSSEPSHTYNSVYKSRPPILHPPPLPPSSFSPPSLPLPYGSLPTSAELRSGSYPFGFDGTQYESPNGFEDGDSDDNDSSEADSSDNSNDQDDDQNQDLGYCNDEDAVAEDDSKGGNNRKKSTTTMTTMKKEKKKKMKKKKIKKKSEHKFRYDALDKRKISPPSFSDAIASDNSNNEYYMNNIYCKQTSRTPTTTMGSSMGQNELNLNACKIRCAHSCVCVACNVKYAYPSGFGGGVCTQHQRQYCYHQQQQQQTTPASCTKNSDSAIASSEITFGGFTELNNSSDFGCECYEGVGANESNQTLGRTTCNLNCHQHFLHNHSHSHSNLHHHSNNQQSHLPYHHHHHQQQQQHHRNHQNQNQPQQQQHQNHHSNSQLQIALSCASSNNNNNNGTKQQQQQPQKHNNSQIEEKQINIDGITKAFELKLTLSINSEQSKQTTDTTSTQQPEALVTDLAPESGANQQVKSETAVQ